MLLLVLVLAHGSFVDAVKKRDADGTLARRFSERRKTTDGSDVHHVSAPPPPAEACALI